MLSFITILAASTIVSAFPAYLNSATEVAKRADQQKQDGLAVTAWCHHQAGCGVRLYGRAGDGGLTEHYPMDEANRFVAENKWTRGDLVGDALPETAVAAINSIALPHVYTQIRVFTFVGGGIQEFIKPYENGKPANVNGRPAPWTSSWTGINATGLDNQRLAAMTWSEGGSIHYELYYVKGDTLYRKTVIGDRKMSEVTEQPVTYGLPPDVNGLSVSVGPDGLQRRLFVEMGGGNVREYYWRSEHNPDWVLSNSIVRHTGNTFVGSFAALYVPGEVLNRLYTLSAVGSGTANVEEWWPAPDLKGWLKNNVPVGTQVAFGSRAPVAAATQGLARRIYVLTRRGGQIIQTVWIYGDRFHWQRDVAIICDRDGNNCA